VGGLVAKRQIPDLLGAGRQREPYQLSFMRLRRGGFRADSHKRRRPKALDQRRQIIRIIEHRYRRR
jgi:hypothetical protein